MIRFSRAQVHPIGLDIGHDSVKMIQLEQVGETLSVVAAAKAPLPAEVKTQPQLRTAAAIDVVRQLLRRNPFRGKLVVTALPREVVHARNLRLPQMPAAELAQVVGFEARNILPFDPAEGRVAHLPAGEVRQGADVRQEVIVLAARNADVSEFLEMINRAGVTVESLDVEACALYRTVDRFLRRREDEQDVFVLVDVGAHRSQVVIGRGREISFIKTIDIGGRHFHEAVSRKLGISHDEAQALRRRLADPVEGAVEAGKRDPVRQAACDASRTLMEELGREISLCLRYYSVTFRGQRPTRVRIVGGEAADPQLQALLSTSLPIPVEVGRPLYSVDTSRMNPAERRGAMSDWTLALGLALKTVKGTFGARDGKPRDLNAPITPAAAAPEAVGAVAEVVDLQTAVQATSVAEPAAPLQSCPALEQVETIQSSVVPVETVAAAEPMVAEPEAAVVAAPAVVAAHEVVCVAETPAAIEVIAAPPEPIIEVSATPAPLAVGEPVLLAIAPVAEAALLSIESLETSMSEIKATVDQAMALPAHVPWVQFLSERPKNWKPSRRAESESDRLARSQRIAAAIKGEVRRA